MKNTATKFTPAVSSVALRGGVAMQEAARGSSLSNFRAAIDSDRKKLCDALGMTQDGSRYLCPFCQNDGAKHADGDFSIEAGFRCHKCAWAGDGLALIQAVRHCSFRESVDFARSTFCISAETPLERPQPTKKSGKVHPTLNAAAKSCAWGVARQKEDLYELTRIDVYKSTHGDAIAAIVRLDAGDQKEYRPLRRVADGWMVGDPEGKWPLFRLQEIAATDGTVYIVEGEKAAMAGADAGLNTSCSSHGAKSASKTDFSPLAGRDVVVLPDNDEAGRTYAEDAAQLCHEAGASSVKIVNLPDLPPKGDLVEYIQAGGTADDVIRLASEAEESKAESLIDSLVDQMFDPDRPPPPLEPILTLKEIPVGTAGNLVGLSGQAGSGKSRVLSAMIASSFTENPEPDFLGMRLANPEGKAVFYLDFEMSAQDHYALMRDACRRAEVDSPPEWFYGLNLTGRSPDEGQAILKAAFAHGQDRHGGTCAVILDGIADMTRSPNDEEQCFGLIRECHALAIEHEALVVGVLHLNPSSDFKTRGHLGSQLERKAESVLTTSRDGDTLTLYCTKCRHRPIPKVQGQRFGWDTERGGFASIDGTVAEMRQSAAAERRWDFARAIFAGQMCSLSHSAAVGRIVELEACTLEAAKKRLSRLRSGGHLLVDLTTGRYSLAEGGGCLL